jgi:TRAP-type C4-dicarboxylate transport system permease small subunit
VPADGSPRSSYFDALTRVLNVIGTVLILVMAVAVNADVIGRDFFNHPIPGVLEFIGLSIVAIVFLQLANTLREARHVSNDLLTQLIVRSHPRLVFALYGSFNLIGAVLMALIVFYIWPLLVQNYVGGYYSGTAGVIEIPIWPFMATVVVGAAVTCVQFLLFAWRDVERARAPERSER